METIAPLIMLGSYFTFIIWQAVKPARSFAPVSWWRLKGVLFFVMTAVISSVLPLLWGDFISRHALLDLSALGTVAGTVVGYAVFQFFAYWWHRLEHTSSFIWRWTHQIHHSAERIDIWGVGLFHPLDIAAYTILSSVTTSFLLGLSPSAVALSGAYGLFAAVFQHANIRTPRWLGYIIQRPEAHGVHHQRGVHAYNYSDLPIWDILFGTFRNPTVWQAQGGFYDGASKRTLAMLVGRDVSTPTSNPMSSHPPLGDPASVRPLAA